MANIAAARIKREFKEVMKSEEVSKNAKIMTWTEPVSVRLWTATGMTGETESSWWQIVPSLLLDLVLG